MKQLACIAGLSVLVLFCACGAQGPGTLSPGSGPPSGPSPGLPSNSSSRAIGANWQFSATSSVQMGPPAKLAGSITQSGNSLVGAMHVDGWNCFDQRTAIGLSGTVTQNQVSLTSTSVDGQVLTLVGNLKIGFPDTFSGTYAITGGCASGDRGKATGYAVASMTRDWAGYLTTEKGESIGWDVHPIQASATPEGSFGLSGTVHFSDCFGTGTITPGTFPDGSFIMGTFVDLEIKTDSATFSFLGTADPDGLIKGNYTASGGPCDLTGTGYLSPWEY